MPENGNQPSAEGIPDRPPRDRKETDGVASVTSDTAASAAPASTSDPARTTALVEAARASCREAAALLRRRAGQGGLTVRSKSAHERVTDADVEVETLLRSALRAAVPGSSVVGEELGEEIGEPRGEDGGAARDEEGSATAPDLARGASVTWYVDPIDGTHNYLRGLPLACVSVGVAVGGRLVGGCVHDVFRDESFSGGVGVPLRVDGAPAPAPPTASHGEPLALSDIPLAGRAGPDEPAFALDLLTRAEVRRLYSTALSLAWVATGRADLACNLHIHPWDVAGGAALVRAAGGTYAPVGGPDPVTAHGFVATRPGLGEDTATAALGRWAVSRLTELAAP
ncbi:inositol monophosphatase family protein [Streptomyces sp. 4N509B]|uniref:inositol monophosphatase family protein n=1 Tax=Streptomyces sp. 4N509B TaxID=3457413 RepID=UPI003FD6B75E